MSRIESCFQRLAAARRKAVIPFITAGDPAPADTVPLMQGLARAGADIIELGVPFSDPMADGPVIQRSSERALRHGVTLRSVLEMVRAFRQTDAVTPVVLMGYLNPIETMGYIEFAQAAQAAGVDGVLTVDMPLEEAAAMSRELAERDLDPIFLLAPTTSDERAARIGAKARGFLYYVSLKGVTGSDRYDVDSVAQRIESLRRHVRLPIAVGFGIKDASSAAATARFADAVVIGSALVGRIEAMNGATARVVDDSAAFLSEIRRAVDAA